MTEQGPRGAIAGLLRRPIGHDGDSVRAHTVPGMPAGESLPRCRHRPLPAGATVVLVRGDDTDPDADRRQAQAFLRRWPDWHRYGLSAYFAEDDDAVADLASDQLERFALLRLYRPEALIAAEIDVVPTFRSPHVTLAFAALESRASRAGNHRARDPTEPVP